MTPDVVAAAIQPLELLRGGDVIASLDIHVKMTD